MMARRSGSRRFSDRLLSLAGLRIVLWALAAQAFLPGVLGGDPYGLTAYHDDHLFYAHEDADREAIVRYHELPTWNPYYCGGVPGIANPQDNSLAPDFLLRILFGVGRGRRLAVLLFVILGMEGLFRLARKHDASVIGAATAALAFGMCGAIPTFVRFGWLHFLTYELFPWIALCFERGISKRRWAVLGGWFLAWVVSCSGTYPAPYAGLLMGTLLLFETGRVFVAPREGERWFSPIASAATMGIVAIGLSAIRTLPLLRVVFGVPRPVSEVEAVEPLTLFASMWSPQLYGGMSDQYIGLGIVALAVLALLLADRAGARFVTLAFVFAAIAVGQWSTVAPWVFLHKLPVYSQLGTPSRIAIVALMFLALAAARGLTKLEDAPTWIATRVLRLWNRRLPIVGRLAAGILGALCAAYVGRSVVEGVIASNAIKPGTAYVMDGPRRYADEFRQSRGNRWDAQVWLPASRGSIGCFEETGFFEAAGLRGDLPEEEFAAPGSDATVRRVSWSPTRIVLDVDARSAARILVNQNFDRHWTSSEGAVVMNPDGLLAIDVPAGRRRVTVSFRDWLVTIGALVTLGTVVLILTPLARCISAWVARRPWRALVAESRQHPGPE
jgi:hypothetical protein